MATTHVTALEWTTKHDQMLALNDACFVYVSPSGEWVLFPRSGCVGVPYACDHTVE